jgi:hypothetical protein
LAFRAIDQHVQQLVADAMVTPFIRHNQAKFATCPIRLDFVSRRPDHDLTSWLCCHRDQVHACVGIQSACVQGTVQARVKVPMSETEIPRGNGQALDEVNQAPGVGFTQSTQRQHVALGCFPDFRHFDDAFHGWHDFQNEAPSLLDVCERLIMVSAVTATGMPATTRPDFRDGSSMA